MSENNDMRVLQEQANKERLKENIDKLQLRIIRYYRLSRKKGVIECTVICSNGTVEQEYKKHKSSRELGKDNPNYCDNCQYTACWDKGKVIRCKEKKIND